MKIAFTSCTRFEAYPKQPHWDLIKKHNPDYLFLLGDNIYMDFGIKPFSKEPIGAPEGYSDDKFQTVMEAKYINQFENVPEFKSLVEQMRSKNGFHGVWDDHDFGWDNAKGHLMSDIKKKISTDLFHKYMKCSNNLPHVYYKIDTPLARVIFLDNRTYAEKEGQTQNLLGATQFDFLKNALNHDLDYTLICGGLSLTPGRESWLNYPNELKKLTELINHNKNVLFLAGDIHKNKFVKSHFSKAINAQIPHQIISSGMNVNNFGIGKPFDNRHNWTLLEINKNDIHVNFYNKLGLQKRRSLRATTALNS